MNVVELANVATLWREAEAYLSSDPANNTHQLSAAKRIMDFGAGKADRFFAVYADSSNGELGALSASAIYVAPKALFLAVMSLDCASALAKHLRENNVQITGVMGRRDVLAAFTDSYARPFSLHVNLMLYQLMSAPDFGCASGEAHIATMSELELLGEWYRAFEIETDTITLPTPLVDRVTRRINNGQLMLWMDAGEPVAMAGVNALPAASARIGPVYTPPALRGRGYAQAVTAAASALVQRDGPRTVFLFTDAVNPASNKAYQRVGFAPIADHAHLLFDTQPAPLIN
ncbi:MAG: GNAT family N-acetyltransferase [Rhizobacter sp.]|nr:GNAT family N-acetyltransferase [Burkholderiales bacterium]